MTDSQTLEAFFEPLLSKIPTGPVGDVDFVFDRDSIPKAPDRLSTGNVVVGVGRHSYSDSYATEMIDWVLGRTTARSLGCWVLSVLLHGGRSSVEIRHPESCARWLTVQYEHADPIDPPSGLSMRPVAVRYWPDDPDRHPWQDIALHPYELPWFDFTNERGVTLPAEADRAERDTVLVAGEPSGIARLGTLLLDAGRPGASCDAFDLEGEAGGMRGVAPGSAELRLWLPWSALFQQAELAAD